MKVDKEVLFEFLVLDNADLTSEHFEEVKKVIKIIFNKWWSSYFSYYDEVEQDAIVTILERKPRYNPKFDAYNYIFTIARNQIGNFITKNSKEVLIDESDLYNAKDECPIEYDDFLELIPKEIHKYLPQLSGEVDFNYVRIPRDFLLPLMLFLLKLDPREVTPKKTYTGEDARYLGFIIEGLLD